MLCCLVDALRRSINRHRTATVPAPVAEPTPPAPGQEAPFWSTPTPRHVPEHQAPLHSEDTPPVPPYTLNETTLALPAAVQRRQHAAALGVGRIPSE
ncbi:hypothetical protein ACWF94_21865 [Streptomyces sp. NPDC055078]